MNFPTQSRPSPERLFLLCPPLPYAVRLPADLRFPAQPLSDGLCRPPADGPQVKPPLRGVLGGFAANGRLRRPSLRTAFPSSVKFLQKNRRSAQEHLFSFAYYISRGVLRRRKMSAAGQHDAQCRRSFMSAKTVCTLVTRRYPCRMKEWHYSTPPRRLLFSRAAFFVEEIPLFPSVNSGKSSKSR